MNTTRTHHTSQTRDIGEHVEQAERSMTAVVQDRYGTADVLQLREIPRPDIGDNDVLVRVAAAGVDRGVWHLMTGRPHLTRLAFGLRRPRNPVPGLDVAGVVDTVGAGVTRFAEGDLVFGTGHGTFAQYARAGKDRLAGIPTNVTTTEAAVLAVTGSTALQAVEDHGHVQPGDQVLVETGHVTPVVDRSFPLAAAADAIAHLESGRTRGKIAIDVDTTEQR
jgi:NADPH:quinone reductase-like Zn-dependent oxidoreductase